MTEVIFWMMIIAFIRMLQSGEEKQSLLQRRGDRDFTNKNNKTKPCRKEERIIVVKKMRKKDLAAVIRQFCETQNLVDFQIRVRLSAVKRTHIITFPEGVGFELFCSCVDYFRYPKAPCFPQAIPQVIGWYFVGDEENLKWLRANFMGQKLMLYMPERQNELGKIFFTTINNKRFKVNLGTFDELEGTWVSTPDYREPAVSFSEAEKLKGDIYE